MGWEGKLNVETLRDDGDVMETRQVPANGVTVAGPVPCASARGVRPERVEKHVVWIVCRKTGSILENLVIFNFL